MLLAYPQYISLSSKELGIPKLSDIFKLPEKNTDNYMVRKVTEEAYVMLKVNNGSSDKQTNDYRVSKVFEDAYVFKRNGYSDALRT